MGALPAQLHIILHILGLLFPSVQACVVTKQPQQKIKHDPCTKAWSFKVGDSVCSKNYSVGSKWIPRVIIETTGPVSYQAALVDGSILKRHLDEICAHYDNTLITNILWTFHIVH